MLSSTSAGETIIRSASSSMMKHDVGQRLVLVARRLAGLRLLVLHLVVAHDVARAGLAEELVAAVHLLQHPLERRR